MALTEDGLSTGHLLQDSTGTLWQCWWPSSRQECGLPRTYYTFGRHLPVVWQTLPHPVRLVATVAVGWAGESAPCR